MDVFKLPFKLSTVIVGLLAFATFPWKLVQEESAAGLQLFVQTYSAFLGPIFAVMVVDYYLVRHQTLESLMADQAYTRLIALLRTGGLTAGQFVSVPVLVDLLNLPLAATREAVKRADARGLVSVLPKRGVLVMSAGPKVTRDCLNLRSILDREGARRLIANRVELPLDELRASHLAMIEAAQRDMNPELPKRAIATDLSLHDALSTGLDNPLAADVYAVNRDRIAVIQNTRPFLPDRIVSAMQEHLAIISALERRDADAAVAAVCAHYRTTLRWWGILV